MKIVSKIMLVMSWIAAAIMIPLVILSWSGQLPAQLRQMSAAIETLLPEAAPAAAADYRKPLRALPDGIIFLKPTLSCETLQQSIDNRGQCELLDAGREWIAYDVLPGIKLDNGYIAFCTGSMYLMTSAPTTACGWSIARENDIVRHHYSDESNGQH